MYGTELMIEIARQIRSYPDAYDQNKYGVDNIYFSSPSCDSPCCIAGHGIYIAGNAAEKRLAKYSDSAKINSIAAALCQIDNDIASALFHWDAEATWPEFYADRFNVAKGYNDYDGMAMAAADLLEALVAMRGLAVWGVQ